MSKTLTIRLTKDQDAWLERVAKETGRPRGQIVREQIERARGARESRSFMRLAGVVAGPRDLSRRKGFSRS
jgi:predicted transcriptional regulator